jgi:putative drug exporter of the RND superfamily
MLYRLGAFAAARRWQVLVVGTLALALAGFFGGGLFNRVSGGGFQDPGAESTRANEIIEDVFNAGNPNVVLLVSSEGSVDDPTTAKAGVALTNELGHESGVDQAFSYWTLGSPPSLRSDDGSQALVLGRIGGSEDVVDERIEELAPHFTRTEGSLTVEVGGQAQVFRQVSDQIEEDLARAESLTFPIVLVLLVLVFGSVIAAGLPLAIGVMAIVGTFLVLTVMTVFTDVSVYSINLTTMLGLGLGIDYALFIVSRYREELHAGFDTSAAVARTVETAGRTVLFSGLTVAASLAALLVFPQYFLKSFAYAGIAVVALSVVGALVFLPALLAALGPRIDKWMLWRRRPKEVGEGFWHRVAVYVMRRAVPIAIAVVTLLLFLGAPFLGAEFGLPDDRVLPADASSRNVQDDIRNKFSTQEAGGLMVVARDVNDPTTLRGDVAGYAADLSRIDGAARVDAFTGSYVDGERVARPTPLSRGFAKGDATWLSVVPSVEPVSPAGEELVGDVRAEKSPFEVLVTGPSAELVDGKSSIFDRVPLAAAIIAVVTFVLLFMMTGSILVPVKAVVLNLLSLTATFGAMVWIFQEGHLSDVLNFTATGTLDTTSPILMFCIAFGLSMDYEVFLLSRIKEEHDRTGDNHASVAIGLEKTGRIVTAAAALIAVVFIAFATSEISFIKLMGVGLSLAVIMDATLIRATLVPAFMRLAGEANWWAPKPLRRLYERYGLKEAVPMGAGASPPGPPSVEGAKP